MRLLLLPFLLLVLGTSAQVPESDLWLFGIKNEKGTLKIEKGQNITNRAGYDNQPSFSPDEKNIYYVSIREDKQADIYVYNISDKKSARLTRTAESEYSPKIVQPNELNVVVVEADSAQRIWRYNEKTGLPDKPLFDVDSVGYYSYLNSDTVLYYKLTDPHTLRARSISTEKDVQIGKNPVRGFQSMDRSKFVFGVKDSARVIFYSYDAVLKKAFRYAEFNSVNEDLLWHPQWGLLKSEGTAILKYDGQAGRWTPLFDFSSFGIKRITRFMFDSKNKKVVIVDNNG